MPLDLLLNSTLGLEETIVSQSESEPISIDKYNESLAIVEKRCNHLAALLAESEANEARLSQLTDALKEEIRRSERAEERQKHIENLEYLKNVVLKVSTNNYYATVDFIIENLNFNCLPSSLRYREERNVVD